MGTLSESSVLNMSTALRAIGSVAVVAVDVDVIVGLTSSQSKESHGHPPGQFSLILIQTSYKLQPPK